VDCALMQWQERRWNWLRIAATLSGLGAFAVRRLVVSELRRTPVALFSLSSG
jgi:hypothetical protein